MPNQISGLPTTAVDDVKQDKGRTSLAVSGGWRNFFNSVLLICGALTESGTTAQRPATFLWAGRMYFDTTLGIPIWYKTVGWVDATGAPA
jgi:hypothetical protein